MRIDVRARAPTSLRCSYCHDDLPADANRCPSCDTRTHVACWEELKGCCPTLGCAPSRASSPSLRVSTSWPRRALADLFAVGVVTVFTVYMFSLVGALVAWIALIVSSLLS